MCESCRRGGGGWAGNLTTSHAEADGFSRHGGGRALRGKVRDAVRSTVADRCSKR